MRHTWLLIQLTVATSLTRIPPAALRAPPQIARGVLTACAAPPESEAPHCVFLMNDSFNMREYVQRVLMMVCYLSESEAMDIMMRANWEYSALVGTWDKPIAEHVYAGMTKAGLQAGIAPADSVPDL